MALALDGLGLSRPARVSEARARPPRWSISDLAALGTLSALGRAAGILAVLLGGGMNPFSLTLRSMAMTAVLIVLRRKVRAFGTLCLATLVGSLVAFLLMAQGLMSLVPFLVAALIAELLICGPGRGSELAVILGVGLMQVLDKAASLFFMWLAMRESPAMMWPIAISVALSAIGDLLACLSAPRFLKELRRAGFLPG